MDWTGIALAAVGPLVGGATSALSALRDPASQRLARLKEYAVLVKDLQDGEAKQELTALIDEKAFEIARLERGVSRRDWSTVSTSLVLLTFCAYGTLISISMGGWWLIAVLPLGVLAGVFAFGIGESLKMVPRDRRGKRLAAFPAGTEVQPADCE